MVGRRVEVMWVHGGGRQPFVGTITRFSAARKPSAGRYHVAYDDGTSEWETLDAERRGDSREGGWRLLDGGAAPAPARRRRRTRRAADLPPATPEVRRLRATLLRALRTLRRAPPAADAPPPAAAAAARACVTGARRATTIAALREVALSVFELPARGSAVVPAVAGGFVGGADQCARHPRCTRGFRHRGKGGLCSLRPADDDADYFGWAAADEPPADDAEAAEVMLSLIHI